MVSATSAVPLSFITTNTLSHRTPSDSESSFMQELQSEVKRQGGGVTVVTNTPPTQSQNPNVSQFPVITTSSSTPTEIASAAPPANTPSNTPVHYQAPPATFTLQSYMQQWLQDVTQVSTLSLVAEGITGPQDFAASAMQAAQGYAAVENPPDSADLNALVAQYAGMAQAAYANVPASQWNPATFTAYALPPAGETYAAGPDTALSMSGVSDPVTESPSTSSPTGTPSNTPVHYQAPPPTFAASSFSGVPTQVATLESYMQQWLQDVTQVSTLTLVSDGIKSPQDFAASAMRAAEGYATTENPPDSVNMNALVAQYAGMAQAAYANVPASQWNPATFTDYALPPAGSTYTAGPNSAVS
jgi:hypothetical protein